MYCIPSTYPLHRAYLEDLHTGRSQLTLWDGGPECPLQVTLEISITRVLQTLLSGPELAELGVHCGFFHLFFSLESQQLFVVTPIQVV